VVYSIVDVCVLNTDTENLHTKTKEKSLNCFDLESQAVQRFSG